MFSPSSFSLLQKKDFLFGCSCWLILKLPFFISSLFPFQKLKKKSLLECLLYLFISSFLHPLSTCSICCLSVFSRFSHLFPPFEIFLFFDCLFVFLYLLLSLHISNPCKLLQNSLFLFSSVSKILGFVCFLFLLDIFLHLFSMFFLCLEKWFLVFCFFFWLSFLVLFFNSFLKKILFLMFWFFHQIGEVTSSFFLFLPFLFFSVLCFFKSFVCEIIVFILKLFLKFLVDPFALHIFYHKKISTQKKHFFVVFQSVFFVSHPFSFIIFHSFFFHPFYLSSLFPFIFLFISCCFSLLYLFSPFSILSLFHYLRVSLSLISLSQVSLSFFSIAFFFHLRNCLCTKKSIISVLIFHDEIQSLLFFTLPSSVFNLLFFFPPCVVLFSFFVQCFFLIYRVSWCYFSWFSFINLLVGVSSKNCRFVFEKFQKISSIQLLIFLCLVVNCSRTFFHAWSKKKNTFLCFQSLFWKISCFLISSFLFAKKIT